MTIWHENSRLHHEKKDELALHPNKHSGKGKPGGKTGEPLPPGRLREPGKLTTSDMDSPFFSWLVTERFSCLPLKNHLVRLSSQSRTNHSSHLLHRKYFAGCLGVIFCFSELRGGEQKTKLNLSNMRTRIEGLVLLPIAHHRTAPEFSHIKNCKVLKT